MTNTNLTRTDVILIVNYSWEKSFAPVDSNKKAIAKGTGTR